MRTVIAALNRGAKDFTPSERVAIGLAVEAELGNRRGQRTDLAGGGLPQNFAQIFGTAYRSDQRFVTSGKVSGIRCPKLNQCADPVVSQSGTACRVDLIVRGLTPATAAIFSAVFSKGQGFWDSLPL